MIAAQAWNEISLGGGETDLVEITIKDVKNDADIIITTAADDDGDLYGEGPVADNGDVLATDINGGENSGGGIDTEAYNNVYNHDTYQPIELTIEGPIENFSDTLINAGDDVMTVAIEDGDTEIDSEAWNSLGGAYGYMIDLIEQGPVRNLAGVDITAGQDVGVMSSYGSWANTGAWAANESSVLPEIFPDTKDNIATVNINAGGGVGVLAEYGSEAQLGAGAEFATTNTSTVTIEADGPVDVKAREDSQAGIMALSMTSIQRNTSNIEINADNVEVNGNAGSDAAISAEAYSAYEEESSENTAGVAIYTHLADVEPDEESGNVLVEASEGGGATIQAMTDEAYSNTSDVLVCADGDVQIYGMMGGDADILADAMNAYSNLAKTRVGARGDEGLIVRAENDGTAFVESWAQAGHTNTAETIVCTQGGVQIVDKSQVATSAGIIAEALNGYYTDAYVGICAQEDIMVMAGIGPEDLEEEIIEGIGGHAMIKAEASSVPAEAETTATAEVAVISHHGGVVVMEATNAVQPRTAEITSSASGGYINTAYTGVSAGGDLLSEGHPLYEESQGTGVFVYGIGDYSHAKIVSETSGGYTNTSDTVVCTPADVVVEAEGQGSMAEIGSCAVDGYIHTATTQVYAGDVDVYIPGLYGEGGIWTYAQGVEVEPHVPYLGDSGNYDPVVGDYLQFILSEYDGDYGYQDLVWVEEEGEDTAQLLIRDYSERQDCPECPPCPCEEIPSPSVPAPPFVPPAPIPERITLEILGYPALMKWVAAELGVGEEKIQIWLANSLASATDIQPYQTYTRFRTAAIILQDSDGSHVAALAQVILELASDTTPPTEEQMASIADAIANNAGANNQYALAGIYLDALAVYIGFLTDEIGFSSEDAVQFVMNKYILPLAEGENAGVAVYVAARLAAQAPEGIEELEQGTTILDVLRARGII